MRNSPWYILLLIAFISSMTGHTYYTSKVQEVTVFGKRIEDGRGRRGNVTEVFVLETDSGDLRILKFPVIGYSFGVDEIYNGIQSGSKIQVRVGMWPPAIISNHAKPQIMAIY